MNPRRIRRSLATTFQVCDRAQTRTVTPSIAISMMADPNSPPRGSLAPGGAIGGTAVSIIAGTNAGAFQSCPDDECARACRRQVKTCWGVSPYRRATAETAAPRASVSSTMRALSLSENRRRRPVPVITSSRRTSKPSGSSVDTSRSPIVRSPSSPFINPGYRGDQNTAHHQPSQDHPFHQAP